MTDLPTPLHRRTPRRVVVIGAGMSGLVAALELEAAGHDVVVVEARERPGGRVLTLRGADGQPVAEAGAGRIPQSHRWASHYIDRMGLETEPLYPEGLSPALYLHGRRIVLDPAREPDWQPPLTQAERALGLTGLTARYMHPGIARVQSSGAIDTPLWPPDTLADLDRTNVRQYFAEKGASSAAIDLLLAGSWPQTIPALTLFRVLATYDGIRKIKGGNDRLPAALAARLRAPIRYRTVVRAISQPGAGVELTLEENGRRARIAADTAICTIPFSLIADVAFDPPLSPAKRRIVSEMHYAPATKLAFVTKSRPWEREGLSGFARLDSMAEIWSGRRAGSGGVLQFYQQGDRALALDAMKGHDRMTSALATVEQVFPGARAVTEAAFEHSWQADPWSRGAYAMAAPGRAYVWKDRIAQPEGRVHFAGEHTSLEYAAWIEGAVRSGYRAAAEVNALD